MHIIKTWRIYDWSPDDIEWLAEQGFRSRVATTDIPFAIGNKVTYMRGDVGVSVETDAPEQELMLKLKFEPGLVLMLEEIMLSDATECTLSNLDFSRFES